VKKPRRSFEEFIGIRFFSVIGIVIVVVGIAYLMRLGWGIFPPSLRVFILYASGLALLAAGIFLERRDRYQIPGRGLIGGGWAVIAATTYAIANLPNVLVLHSPVVDLYLLLAVVAAMVWHTLKYDSQVVTGAAFLLGFAAITMNPVPPYNLIAGAMLIAGMTVIVLRYKWYELEVFGILASYLNHFYWLYQVKHDPLANFPHVSSLVLVIGYWVIFRTSYLWRKISNRDQESISTLAGLLNPALLLGVLKYQSFHPDWAFYALLGMGAIEFTLGQIPVARQRRAPFLVLSSLGATLMVAAFPFKYSGNSLELLWLAAAETFLLAGIFTRERLFRGFGIIVSFLVALNALPERIMPLWQQIADGKLHQDSQLSLILAVIALVLYANAHLTRRIWPDLFVKDLDRVSLTALSYGAGLFASAAIYCYFPDKAVAVALAAMLVIVSWSGRQWSFAELIYQGHALAAVAIAQVTVTGTELETAWHGVPMRMLTFAPVAGLLYLSSRFVRLSQTFAQTIFAAVYAWAATGLLTLLIGLQATHWAVAVLWIVLGLALTLFGETLKRADLKWQAFVLVLLAAGRALAVNFNLQTNFHHVSMRLISVGLVALGIYLLARWAPLTAIRPVYTVLGTFLLSLLAFKEAPAPWTAVAWISLALALGVASRLWKDRALLWQTHVLSLLAVGWTLYANFAPEYRFTGVQRVTVGITAVLLYALTRITNIAAVIEDERISQGYAWAGSLLLSWLAWYQVPAIYVTLAWGLFGLVLFEVPELARSIKIDVRYAGSWRAQSYVALAGSFAHMFYSNFNAPGLGAALYLVLPLPFIYFYVYWQLTGKSADPKIKVSAGYLVACLGTATLAALSRFELGADMVAAGYAALVILTLLVVWLAHRQVFLYQAMVLLAFAAVRLSMTNFYHLKEPYSSSLNGSIWTITLLAFALPLAFKVRSATKPGDYPGWASSIALHPEQPMFFVPVLLLVVLLFLKLSGWWITLGWAIEGLTVFVLALQARERSFRLTGLSLLLLSIGKLVYDALYFPNKLWRAATFVIVGLMILVIPLLYGRNREALRDYL
jgi:heme/copper-type cytochrome/quinol oxidase subunit 4